MKIRRIQSALLLCAMLMQPIYLSANENTEFPEEDTFRGEDMCIAILDRGFTLEHESFILTDDTPRITKEVSDSLLEKTSAYAELKEMASDDSEAASVYVSEKIPFAYDYGDGDRDVSQNVFSPHGTAMISIAAGTDSLYGNSVAVARGVAPEAQIFAMKIYSDELGGVSYKAMADAINDAVILGAHVICISVCDIGGFESSAYEYLELAIDNAWEKGVIIVSGAGDIVKYGKESVFHKEEGIYSVITDSPDVGTVAYPSSSPKVISVGSAENNEILSDCFTLSDGTEIPYGDSNYFYDIQGKRQTFGEHFDGKTLEYVVCDGIGTREEISALGDLTGKLLVLNRGEISFVQKAQNAAEAGAIGVIVVDTLGNQHLALETNLDLTDTPVPVIIIQHDSLSHLQNSEEKNIYVKTGKSYKTVIRETPKISAFSAYGTTVRLGIKPDVITYGSSVKCAYIDGGYSTISSTTAAAARVAGMCAVIKEYLASKNGDLTDFEMMNAVRTLLVNSAEIMLHATGAPYSPRVQGGGAATLEGALSNHLVLTSEGSYKAELGDGGRRIIEFELTATNLSHTPKACTLDGFVGSDGYEVYSYGELDNHTSGGALWERFGASPDEELYFMTTYELFDDAGILLGDSNYQLNSVAEGYSPYTFTLKGGESQRFRVKVYVYDDTFRDYTQKFENGFFIEGFMRLYDGECTASLPFTAFHGNFGKAEALDSDIFGDIQSIYDYSYLYCYEPSSDGTPYRTILGEFAGEDGAVYDDSQIIFSSKQNPKGDIMLNLGLKRSLEELTVTVKNAEGMVVSEKMYHNLTRSYVSANTNSLVSPNIKIWNGRDENNHAYVYGDGEYDIIVSYKRVSSDSEKSFSYKLHIDNSPPEIISSAEIRGMSTFLNVRATDAMGIKSISVFDSEFNNAVQKDDGLFYISLLWGKYIYIEATDLAGNKSVERIDNPCYADSE